MQKSKPVSLSGYLSLGACILLWAGIIAFTSPRHSLVLDTARSGEIWQGQDLVAPFAFDILRDSVDINQDVTEIKRQFPIPLFFNDSASVRQHIALYNVAFSLLFQEEKRRFLDQLLPSPDSSASDIQGVISAVYESMRKEEAEKQYPSSDSLSMIRFGEEYIRSYYQQYAIILSTTFSLEGDARFLINNKVLALSQLLSMATFEGKDLFFDQAILDGLPGWELFSSKNEWSKAMMENALPKHPLSTLDMGKYRKNSAEVQLDIQRAMLSIDSIKEHYEKGELIVAQGEKVGPDQVQALEILRTKSKDSLLSDTELLRIDLAKFMLIVLILFGGGVAVSKSATNHAFSIRLNIVTTSLIGLFCFTAVFTELYIPEHLSIIPLAIAPVVILAFYDRESALVVLLATAGLSSIIVSDSWAFLIRHLVVGVGVIYWVKTIRYWSDFLRLSLLVLSINAGFETLLFMLGGAEISVDALWVLSDVAVQSFLTFLALPIILLFERLYGTLSELRLVELSDINKPLLKKLSNETPGTFQHSLQVANLAEYAAETIGADGLLVKVGALYHDVGKMNDPQFFIENQHPGQNPHERLTARISAQKIIEHVPQGLVAAKEYRLPHALQQFILTHHGDSRVEYFYQKSLRDDDKTRESDYKYPGPPPQTKEEAILMMADAAEASSKSLKAPDEESISAMVDKVIDKQMQEGQFRESNITIQEISLCKAAFKSRLNNIHHIRIAYPPEKK